MAESRMESRKQVARRSITARCMVAGSCSYCKLEPADRDGLLLGRCAPGATVHGRPVCGGSLVFALEFRPGPLAGDVRSQGDALRIEIIGEIDLRILHLHVAHHGFHVVSIQVEREIALPRACRGAVQSESDRPAASGRSALPLARILPGQIAVRRGSTDQESCQTQNKASHEAIVSKRTRDVGYVVITLRAA